MKYDGLIFKKNNRLSDFHTDDSEKFTKKQNAEKELKKGIKRLSILQDKLYASDRFSILIIFQAMDAAGKDGTIKHVMSGINPQGCQVKSFKAPSTEEIDHDYLWRCSKALPEKGNIGIFNRSYYEEVLVTRVHNEILDRQKLPVKKYNNQFWRTRFEQINNFEKYLSDNGTIILKFFLYVSKDEQKKRFLERINDESKNWKFSYNDINERKYWKDYMNAYEQIFKNTSTEWAPWHIIPADKKWFMRSAVCDIIVSKLNSLKLDYPEISTEQKEMLSKAKEILETE